jgi:hypothetical protein
MSSIALKLDQADTGELIAAQAAIAAELAVRPAPESEVAWPGRVVR